MLDVFLEQKGPGFNINMCNNEGETALHVAARNGKIQSCKILLRRGAEIMPDAYAKTPYDLAVSNGHTYCASLLRARLDGNFASASDLGQYTTRDSATNSMNKNVPILGVDATVRNEVLNHMSHSEAVQPGLRTDASQQNRSAERDPFNMSSPRGSSSDIRRVLTSTRAMYNYKASEEPPFPPDERPELSLIKA